MAVVTKGVFPVHAGSFEVDTSETPHTTPVWSKVAELEEKMLKLITQQKHGVAFLQVVGSLHL